MARTIFNAEDWQAIDGRRARLDPAAPPRFGRMTPATMICHLKDAIEVALARCRPEQFRRNSRSCCMQPPDASWADHPAFGDINGKDYGVLLYRHFDHHLRQFGA